MTIYSKREQVLNAVLAMIAAAVPGADVQRNQDKSDTVGPGGRIIILDGNFEEIEVVFSPLTYTYEHSIPLEVAAFQNQSFTREQALDLMLQAIGTAVLADTTMGGLVEYLEARAPDNDDAAVTGSDILRWSNVVLVATYSTNSPLI